MDPSFCSTNLDAIGLQAGALRGEAPPSVILRLGIMVGPALALLMLIPLWMAMKLNFSMAGHTAVQQALRERAAQV